MAVLTDGTGLSWGLVGLTLWWDCQQRQVIESAPPATSQPGLVRAQKRRERRPN